MKKHEAPKKLEAIALFCLIGAISIIGSYSWYLVHMDPHVNWTLMAVLTLVCLASSLVILRGHRRRAGSQASKRGER